MIILLLFFFIAKKGKSQDIPDPVQQIDSLWGALKNDTNISDSLRTYHELIKQYNGLQNDTVVYMSKVLIQKAPPNDVENVMRGNYELLRYSVNHNKLKKGDSLAQVIYAMASKESDKVWLFRILNIRAVLFSFTDQRDSADVYFDRSKKLLTHVENPRYKADYYQFRGLHHRRGDELDKTMENYMEALQMYKDEKMFESEAGIYNNMGTIYGEKANYDQALNSFQKALEINQRLNNKRLMSSNFVNLGRIYEELEQHDRAIEYYMKGLSIEEVENDYMEMAEIYSELGISYSAKKENAKAQYFYNLALKNHDKVDDKTGYARTAFNVIEYHMDGKEYKKAAYYLERIEQILKKKKLYQFNQKFLLSQSRLDSANGKYKEAFFNYIKYKALSDSIRNVQNVDKLQELQTKYEMLEKEKQIENLNTLNKANELAIVRKKYQNFALWGALLFAIMIAIGLYSRYHVKGRLNKALALRNQEVKTKNKDLTEKGLQLQNALAEREVLIKEIHHRVKNNLQLITSMLNLQGAHTKNVEVGKFLKRSQARISSMALVHQTLYNSQTPGTINLKKYLEKLMKAVYLSFEFEKRAIDYKVTTDSIMVDIDTAINLGIVINELVYNAFKHAFVDKTSGLLEINVDKGEKYLEVNVLDNGIGISSNSKGKKDESFGLTLVSLLIEQLDGKLKLKSDTAGTQIKIILNTPTINYYEKHIDS